MFNYNIYQQKLKEKEALEDKKEDFLKQFKKRESNITLDIIVHGKKMVENH
jgi:hypothetical protein